MNKKLISPKSFCVSLFLLGCIKFLSGQGLNLEPNFFNHFEGELDGQNVRLVLWAKEDGTVQGRLCTLKNEKVEIRGNYGDSQIMLFEMKDDSVRKKFIGTYSEHFDNNQFKGAFYKGVVEDLPTGNSSEFRFKNLGYYFGGGSEDENYPMFFGTDEEVDNFLSLLKDSILNDNSEWIANHINYPIYVGIGKNEKLQIYDKRTFLSLYQRIFPTGFKQKVRGYFPCLCSSGGNGERAMFGRGEIWIENTAGSTQKDYGFAINNIFGHGEL